MKNIIASLIVIAASATAQADGWVCSSDESNLQVKVYNQTQPKLGTRNAAVMVISDAAVGAGRKTIARFEAAEGLVAQLGATYTGKVDLRFNNTGRKGELIGGTKLGEVALIHVLVDFSYEAPLAHGEETSAELLIVKRDGEEISETLTCARYLKN
jgi:hypothetical protein